jgi:hypothetical protein
MDTGNLYNHGVALFDTKYRYLQWFIYSACKLTAGFVIQRQLFKCYVFLSFKSYFLKL